MKRRDVASSIITVGDGRGFVVMTRQTRLIGHRDKWYSFKRDQPLIVTAAHCLPHFPPCHGFSYTEERIYADLIGPLGETPSVFAECLFADPIATLPCSAGRIVRFRPKSTMPTRR